MTSSRPSKLANSLRQKAETLLKKENAALNHSDVADVGKLAYELAVHQAELELQNEELREAQQALMLSRDRFSFLFHNAPVGYLILDASGIIREHNLTFNGLLLREEEDFRGQPLTNFIFESDVQEFLGRFRSFFQKPKNKRILVRLQRKDGQTMFSQLEAKPNLQREQFHQGPNSKELLIIVTDISELHEAQEQLREQNQRLTNANEQLEHIFRVLEGAHRFHQGIQYAQTPDVLIESVCEQLTESGGFNNVWVVLLDPDTGKASQVASAGSGQGCRPLKSRMLQGDFPKCFKDAMMKEGIVIVENTATDCPDCSIPCCNGERAEMLQKLEYAGQCYGVINVTTQNGYASMPQELALFQEVVSDLSLGLHKVAMAGRLEENRKKYQEIFRHSRDGFVMTRPDGSVLEANQAFGELTGYSIEALKELDSLDLLTPVKWQKWEKKHLNKEGIYTTGGTGLYEKEYIRKDGTIVPIEILSHAVVNERNGVEHVWSIVRDISERKHSEKLLMESERFARATIDGLYSNLCVLDQDGNIIAVNQSWRDFAKENGANPDSVSVGVNYFEMCQTNLIVDIETARTFENGIKEVLKGSRSRFKIEYPCHAPDKERWFHGQVTAFPGPGDKKVVVVHENITERKMAEREREFLKEQLNQAQKLEAIGRLAGGVAHDFNNMLSVIIGFTEIVKDEIEKDSYVQGELDEILKAANRSAEITRQLLAFARKQTIVPKTLDINQVVTHSLRMITRLIGEDIELDWNPGANLPAIFADPTQLDQILANLCVNAKDAIMEFEAKTGKNRNGSIKISTRIADIQELPKEAKTEQLSQEFVLLSIEDNGIGMDEDVLEYIFEPFFTSKKVGEGTGLGLATVYGIIKQNNGFVSVESQPGKGTVFKIFLPEHWQLRSVDERHISNRNPAGKGETILIVEDEDSILRLTERILTRMNYRVLAANSPSIAVQLAVEFASQIDLLITDVIMPNINGRELAEQIQALHPNIRVLFMSGYNEEVIDRQGLLDDKVNFIPKPFSNTEFTRKVQEVLKSPN